MKNFLISMIICFWATIAMAHSPLDQTTPANEDLITEVPTEILMKFKADIRMTRVSISYEGDDSIKMDLGNQINFMQEFSLPMHDMGKGAYVIEWRGLSADGHALNGDFSFTVE
jgi:methionine-rich copper-binding protein CopC